MTFQYHVLRVDDDWLTSNKGGDASEALDTFGQHGWDIAAAITVSDSSHIIILRQSHSN